MKTIILFLVSGCFVITSTIHATAQGFINPGFEDYDPSTQFLAGWDIKMYGVNRHLLVDYSTTRNGVFGSTIPYRNHQTSIAGPAINANGYDPLGLAEGDYYYFGNSFDLAVPIILKQEIIVPDDARSMTYRTVNGARGAFEVEIDGMVVDPVLKRVIVPSNGYTVDWAVDVSGIAGKKTTISFVTGTLIGFDRLTFSTEAVPEPTGLGIFAFGFLGLGLLWRKKVGES